MIAAEEALALEAGVVEVAEGAAPEGGAEQA
jgi:hypothetical protein